MAAAGLTHLRDLTDPNGDKWLSHKDLVRRCKARGIPCPCTEEQLLQIRADIPTQWRDVMRQAVAVARAATPLPTISTLITALPPPPGPWFRLGGRAGPITSLGAAGTVYLNHRVSSLGVLTYDGLPVTAQHTNCVQIHAWVQQRIAHNKAQSEARERALERGEPDPFPPIYLTSGATSADNPNTAMGANPSHFCITYPETDRQRPPTPLQQADVNHIYLAQVATYFHPLRTLDPEHTATTTTSTSWIHLTNSDSPEEERKKRLAIVQRPITTQLPPYLLETQLQVRSDSLHLGDRCIKTSCTKGICDLCFILRGQSVPETTKHTVIDCPFSSPVVYATQRYCMKITQPQAYRETTRLSETEFCETFERRAIFGVADFDPPEYLPPVCLRPLIAAAAAITNHALIRRRNNNALDPSRPLQHDTLTTINQVLKELCEVASALRTVAEREEDRIYTHYEGWLPEQEKLPTEIWQNTWTAMMTGTQPTVTLKTPPPTPTSHPTYDTADPTVSARIDARSKLNSY